MAALNGAIPLTQVNRPIVAVAQDLNLDVAGALQKLFKVERAVSEGGFGLRLRHAKQLFEFLAGAGNPHPLAAAAGGCLDHHRIADALGRFPREAHIGQRFLRSRYDRHARVGHRSARFHLVAHHSDLLRGRTDENDVRPLTDLREFGVLCQEAVARMDGVGAGDLRRRDDPWDVQVALTRLRRTDADIFIREADV